MALFFYRAYDSSGGKCEGTLDADTKELAQQRLEKQGLHVFELKPLTHKASGFSLLPERVSVEDLEFLTSELSLLLATGVRIDRGLDIIAKSKAKPVLAKLLNDLSQSIKKGSNLSAACRAHPKVFDNLYCNLIELGEASGDLAGTFAGLAEDLKFKRDLKKKIISAMTYPSVILLVCLLAVFFIFNVIIPKMAEMFSQVEGLPWYTQVMLGMSDWFVNHQMLLLLTTAVVGLGLVTAFKQPAFIKWWHKAQLRLPLVGNAVETVERIRFNTGLSLMLKAGVPIDKALDLATGNINNQILHQEMSIARAKVKRGEQLSVVLRQTSIYPAFYVSLLEVGEESGNLQRVFEEIATRSKQDFESWTEKMTALLEPLMILFMGFFVGGVVVAMMLSMVSLNDVGF